MAVLSAPPRPQAHHWVYEDGKLPRCSACFAVEYGHRHWADVCLMAPRPYLSKRELMNASVAAGQLVKLDTLPDGQTYYGHPFRSWREWMGCFKIRSRRTSMRGAKRSDPQIDREQEIVLLRRERRASEPANEG